MFLSGVSFEFTWLCNLEGAGPGEVNYLGYSEGTRSGHQIGISYGEVPGITLRVAYRRKLVGDKGSRKVLSGGSSECTRDGNI